MNSPFSAPRPGAAEPRASVALRDRFSPSKKPLLKVLALALALSAAPEAMAVNRWFDCASGSMQTASCWSGNIKPGAADNAYIGYSSYAAPVTASLTSGTFTASGVVVGYSGYNGTVNHSAGTLTVSSGLSLGASTGITGTYNLSGTGVVNAYNEVINNTGIFNQTGGTHTVSTTLSIGYSSGSGSTYNLQGGSLTTNYTEFGSGTFTQSAGTHTNNNFIISNGTYNLQGGNLTNLSTGFFGNAIGSYGAGVFNHSGGTYATNYLMVGLSNGYSYANGTYNLSGTGVLNTANSEIIGYGAAGTFTQTGGTHTVGGTVSINNSSSYILQGGMLDASTIELYNGTFNFTGGTLAVDQFTGNLVNNGGTLAPGNSPGTTNITGNYTQSAAGIFAVEIGGLLAGGEYDTLNVSGTANLDGTLNVSLFDLGSGLFAPQAGDSFDILTADILSGSFSTLSFATLLNPNLSWQIDYLTDAIGTTDVVRLSVVSAVPVPGAVWLFGSGLLGLMGFARRKK